MDRKVVLASLLSNDLIEVHEYSDTTPPKRVKPLKIKRMPPPYPVYEGWAVSYPAQSGIGWQVTIGDEEGYAVAGVRSQAPQLAKSDESQGVYLDLSSTDRQSKRENDVIALQVANQAVHADIYVTRRPYLHTKSRWASEPGLTVCDIDEAITLVSLYLRTQDQFILPGSAPGVRFSYNRGLFFWVGARELLPEAWRWFSACVKYNTASGDDKLLFLGGSLLTRITKALQARDDVHVALGQPLNNDTSDDALGSLDVALVLLMGAIDASARVAHHLLGVTTSVRTAGWQSAGWLAHVTPTTPNLSALVQTGTPGEHTLTILRLLRNSVHGAALQGISYQAGGNHELLVGLPADDEADILAAMDAMGGRASWGFRPILPGKSHIEPAVLIDRLFEEVITLLNDLMRETPVELLPGVTLTPDDKKPPVDNPDRGQLNTFSENNRLAIRWQLGF
jgi:hypothetical protein